MPRINQIQVLRDLRTFQGSSDESDIQRKRIKRSAACEVFIPPVADPERRAACLADPVLFLRTYNPKGEKGFTKPFAVHHFRMIAAIHERAISGGDKAVAAPRGDGKTTVAAWMVIYIMLAGLVRSLVIVGATRKHAQRIFKDIKQAMTWNDLLADDFPEISACVRELEGAPQRAAKQHVDGEPTRIVWTQDEIELPHVPGSIYGGARIAYYGLDSAIRGGRFEFALIDDPETREVAFNDESNRKIEEMIDSDIAGLAYPDSTISRVILTTVQNRHCFSYRVTNDKLKPTFAGERYGVLSSWPTNRELWDEYIAKRQLAQANGDKDGLEALRFYLDNREAMDAGAVVTNQHRYNQRLNELGETVEVSALQGFFNRVADWGLARVLAELQNDPQAESENQTLSLTPGKVQSRISGLMQHDLPKVDGVRITVGMDVGNRYSHWVKVAWFGNATGCVIDYGVMETPTMELNADANFLVRHLVPAMIDWRSSILSRNPPEFCLIDSGSGLHQEAVYEFVRQVGGNPFAASKGWANGRLQMGVSSATRRLFQECYAQHQPQERLWLYHVNTEFWKQWIQERFSTPTFDESMQFVDGSLSLYASPGDSKKHLSIAHHITAEERRELFVEGKGMTRKWFVKSDTNHYLDAIALAGAAAGVIGIRLIPRVSVQVVEPVKQKTAAEVAAVPKFQRRQGGWVPRSNSRR